MNETNQHSDVGQASRGADDGAIRRALEAYVAFAKQRRTEIGSLSDEMEAVDAQARAALALPAMPAQPELTVSYGPMPESNGRSNFTATLKRKGASMFDTASFTFSRSEYPDRVRYDADRMRFLIGELAQRPDILAYDDKKHSGYVEPERAAPAQSEPFKWPNNCSQSIPRALRYLADHERPGGGEQNYNSAHLFQLADEMERAVKLIAAVQAPGRAAG